MRRGMIVFMALALSLVLISAACAPTAEAPESVADFYKNNTVYSINPGSPGGTTDYGNRLFAAYWADVTGGPMMSKVVRGGSGLQGINQLYNTSKPDGLTIAAGVGWDYMLYGPVVAKNPAVDFDITKFSFIGSFMQQGALLALSSKIEAETLDDLKGMTGLRFGAHTPDSAGTAASAALIEILGLKDAKIIAGLGSVDLGLALAKGELDAATYTSTNVFEWYKNGWVKAPLMVIAMERKVFAPDTPAIPELIQLTPEQEKTARTLDFLTISMQVWMAPPGVPADRLQFLRDSYMKVMDLEGFQKQALRKWPVWLPPEDGEEFDAWVQQVMAQPTEDAAALLQLPKKYLAIK